MTIACKDNSRFSEYSCYKLQVRMSLLLLFYINNSLQFKVIKRDVIAQGTFKELVEKRSYKDNSSF